MTRGAELVASFHQALPSDLRADCPADAIARTLADHHVTGMAAWPDLAVTADRFAAELGRRLGVNATPDQLAAIEPADVYLAIACCDGNAVAQRAVAERAATEVSVCATRLRATQHFEDARGTVHRILLVTEPGRPAAISTFSGRGNLRAYIRVIASRELVRLLQVRQREELVDDTSMLDALVTASGPDLEALRERFRPEVDASLRAAVAALDPRSRALFRYNLIDGWNIERIAAIYGVHRATIARWIAAARDELVDLIERELGSRLAIGTEEVGSIIRLVRSRIDVSLARLLDDP